jgi:ribosome-associated protein
MMDALKIAEICAAKCLEKKGENVVIIDLENRSSVADYFVVASGFSDRQVSAIAEHVADELKSQGQTPLSKEGMVDGRWALIDFGSVIVHIFQDALRDFYSLETLWADAPKIRIQDQESKGKNDLYDPSDFDSGSARF